MSDKTARGNADATEGDATKRNERNTDATATERVVPGDTGIVLNGRGPKDARSPTAETQAARSTLRTSFCLTEDARLDEGRETTVTTRFLPLRGATVRSVFLNKGE
jgi:hypothetical protein